MRIPAILFLSSCLIVSAADTAKQPDLRPEFSFPTQQAIRAWATNAFGGYDFKVYTHDQKRVLVVWRRFTSGVMTSDLSFFVQSKDVEGKDQWHLALWYPVRREGLRTKERGEGIEIQCYDDQRKEWIERLFIRYEALLDIAA